MANGEWSKIDLEALKEAREQILEAAESIKYLIRRNGTNRDYEAAKAYWLGHILAAVDNGEYVERNTMLAFMKTLGYNEDTEEFEDAEEEEEDSE